MKLRSIIHHFSYLKLLLWTSESLIIISIKILLSLTFSLFYILDFFFLAFIVCAGSVILSNLLGFPLIPYCIDLSKLFEVKFKMKHHEPLALAFVFSKCRQSKSEFKYFWGLSLTSCASHLALLSEGRRLLSLTLTSGSECWAEATSKQRAHELNMVVFCFLVLSVCLSICYIKLWNLILVAFPAFAALFL